MFLWCLWLLINTLKGNNFEQVPFAHMQFSHVIIYKSAMLWFSHIPCRASITLMRSLAWPLYKHIPLTFYMEWMNAPLRGVVPLWGIGTHSEKSLLSLYFPLCQFLWSTGYLYFKEETDQASFAHISLAHHPKHTAHSDSAHIPPSHIQHNTRLCGCTPLSYILPQCTVSPCLSQILTHSIG